MTTRQPQTVFEVLVAALRRAGTYNQEAEVAPLAILWPDGGEQWRRVAPRLRESLPLLTLGAYNPETATGPAIWIRADLATRAPGDTQPIVYLPGIRKEVFRNVEEAPIEIQPLLFLQYRGAMFLQPNGKDWTIAAFLQNAQHGLGLRVDGTEATRAALVSASPALLERALVDLRSHPGGIDADFLNTLLISDLPRRILEWINDPAATRAGLDAASWAAFRQQLQSRYKLDPERDGPSEAARLLGGAEAGSFWLDVWNRFAESPALYPAIPDKLRGAKPGETGLRGLFGSAASNYHWPQDNEADEDALRQALSNLAGAKEGEARQAIIALEERHAPRRVCVWAKLGKVPLAFALDHLARIAHDTASPFSAGSVATMASRYTESGWKVDAAALDALTAVTTTADRDAVATALDAIYTPWLWSAAERFQEAMAEQPISGRPSPLTVPPGGCVLFADGLRYDLAARLTDRLNAAGMHAAIAGSVGPIPGVTPSAKPAQSPVADVLTAGARLNANVIATGKAMNQTALKKLLADKGWRFLASGETGSPDGTVTAWTEQGNIDSYGHNHPHDLPRQAQQELAALQARIAELLATGWSRVVVVTDHGWLLTPRPMPKIDLPEHLTVERKGRCARLNPGASTDVQTVSWCWDSEVAIAMAPGVSCFEVGKRYEHGGLSLQECMVPTVTVTAAARSTAVTIAGTPRWRGLRCTVELTGSGAGLSVDIRRKAGDASTSLAASASPVSNDGTARVLIDDDAYEGSPAIIVVLDGNGTPIAQRATIIGEE